MNDRSLLRQANLRILATTDVHAHLLPYDYFSDREERGSGLSAAAEVIHAQRDTADNVLLLDNGDFLQGTPMAEPDAASEHGDASGPHPAILAMNTLRYDAGTLGNHEFNFGLPILESAIAAARFPIVLANVLRRDGRHLVPPWTILDRDVRLSDGTTARLRIGIIGFAPPQIAEWDAPTLQGAIQTRDILQAARQELPALRSAGADIVIALCHSGIAGSAPFPQMENAAVPLAALNGIDVVICGHTHQVFPGPQIPATRHVDPEGGTLHGKPTVMAGHNASHVGRIDLALEQPGEGQPWQVTAHRVAALPAHHSKQPDPEITMALAPHHARTLARIRKPIGHSCTRIESYFALAAPSSAIQALADAQRHFVTDTIAGLPDLPLISAASASRAGGRGGSANFVDIPEGPLFLGAAASLYPFPNALCVAELNGRAVRDWLERSASLFEQIPEGACRAPLVSPEAAGYNFDVLDGLTYTIDLRAAPRFQPDGTLPDERAGRIRDLSCNGTPVRDDQGFLVITNTFRTAGGGRFRAAHRANMLFQSRLATRDILARYLAATPTLSIAPKATWRFASHATTTTATFDTGPSAIDLPLPETGHGIGHIGSGGDGFERFEIKL